ncbi:carbohydrate-binding wsc protein [Moesziomyces antarcticus]|nr:carbohydrate-binding wsc protein [Moesziomyces antarcticus]GAK62057.1 carbohydrate-binding wsc protein [Moesziomyces antarcticus]
MPAASRTKHMPAPEATMRLRSRADIGAPLHTMPSSNDPQNLPIPASCSAAGVDLHQHRSVALKNSPPQRPGAITVSDDMRCLAQLLLLLVATTISLTTTAHAWDWLPATDNNRTLDTTFVVKAAPPSSYTGPILTTAQQQGLNATDFYLYNYITTGYNATKIQRAVIMLHGLGRDAWSYFDQTHVALLNATSRKERTTHQSRLRADEVVIMAPIFLNQDDPGCYPVDANKQPNSTALVWNDSDWAEGADSIYPSTVNDAQGIPFAAPGVSSFEALDMAVGRFANKTLFPNLNTIIVAGHSLGAQMVQRYALIGAVPSGTVPVHFVVANPGSYAYLTEWRPRPYDKCADTFNDWKFGLNAYSQSYLSDFITDSLDTTNDVESVVQRYRRRVVSYLFGLADHGKGDTRCEARAQGTTHLGRGRNFVKHLTDMDGGFPAAHTVNYIPNVSHDGLGMFTSQAGLERLFFINLNGTETPTAVGDDDQSAANWQQAKKSAQHSASSAATVRARMVGVGVVAVVVAMLLV